MLVSIKYDYNEESLNDIINDFKIDVSNLSEDFENLDLFDKLQNIKKYLELKGYELSEVVGYICINSDLSLLNLVMRG